jgi:hypothetical protein
VVSIKFDKFGGQIPAVDSLLLPIMNASYSENAFLQAGRLEPLAADIPIHTLANSEARYAFRVPITSPSIDNITDSYWIEFEDADTSVVRSPVTDLADGGRFYWANGVAPPGYTTKERIEQALPPLLLGIPRPPVAPGVVPSGGTTPTGTRAYVYTWVSASLEEGQPSPPTVATGNLNGTWTITMTAPIASDTNNRTLTYTRIYRTEVGPAGEVGFFFVAQIPIATLTYADTMSSDIVANSEQMMSEDWSGPPWLVGLVSMPNGMIAGWKDNEVWFCEPYRPHAWPAKYTINVEYPIVGLGTIDQTVMILTSGQPYAATGVHPEVMSMRQVQPLEPCTSQGSIVSTPMGVLYTSYNGLIMIGPGGGKNMTFDIIRKDEWLRLINLNTLHATYFMNGYYTYSGAIDGVFQEDTFQVADDPATIDVDDTAYQGENFLGTMVGAHINLTDDRLGFMTLRCDSPTYNVMLDSWTGETLVIRSGKVFHVDRRQYTPRQSYIWQSKLVQTNWQQNFSAVKVFFSPPLGPAPSEPTLFRYYVDKRLRYTRPITKSGEQFRLPSGFKSNFVMFELAGQFMIHNMQVATSPRELREV